MKITGGGDYSHLDYILVPAANFRRLERGPC